MGARPRVLLGTAQLTTRYGVTNSRAEGPTRAASLALLARAASVGVTTVDTAPVYGEAEEVIGLSPAPLTVHTKVRTGSLPSASLAASEERLLGHPIEVLYLHDPEEVVRRDSDVLRDAREATGATATTLGASIYDIEQFEAAVSDPTIGFVQVPVNLLDRRFSGHRLEQAHQTGTRVIARSALLQGVLAVGPDRLPSPVSHLSTHVAEVAAVADEAGLSPLEVAVSWVFGLAMLDGVVLGVAASDELEPLLRAADAVLEPALRDALDAIDLPESTACDPRGWAT